jgi:hypothetical protein
MKQPKPTKLTSLPTDITSKYLSEHYFWELVKIANWPKRNKEDVKIEYIKKLSREDAIKFYAMVSSVAGIVSDRIPQDLGIGDDGFSDLIKHVVGLGKKKFHELINNPIKIVKMAMDSNYKECFSYCIPTEFDYDNLEKGDKRFSDWAKEAILQINKILKMDKKNDLSEIKEEFIYILEALDYCMDYRFTTFLAFKKPVLMKLKKIKKFYEANYFELPRKFTEEDENGNDTRGYNIYFVENLFVDLEEYLKIIKK